MTLVQGVSHGAVWVDRIVVSSPFAPSADVACGDELSNDGLRSSLGNSDARRNIAPADIRLFGDADQNVCVVGKEGPGSTLPLLAHGRPPLFGIQNTTSVLPTPPAWCSVSNSIRLPARLTDPAGSVEQFRAADIDP